MRRGLRRAGIPLSALLLLGCGGGGEEAEPRSLPAGKAAASGSERERELGPFLSVHWRLPIRHQGTPPASYSEADRSLDPASCGACHPKQYAEWKTSLHAGAFSPGFSGQLIEGSLASPTALRQCQTCHTPLAEQQPVDASGQPEPVFDPSLRSQGVVCAACHVRRHRRFGPPRREDAAPPPDPVPHGGFDVRVEYQESRFCAPCHQFFDDAGVNGKPVENTFAEWKASPHAREGRSCQSCHMPDRAHLWRGIHDPEMVRSAVAVELVAQDLGAEVLEAALLLRNENVGHAFPSYVTPRVFLALWQVDAEGVELGGTRLEAAIGRKIDFGRQPRVEQFDTRVRPGESVKLDYAVARHQGATTLVGRVTVDPDYHYRGVFDSLRSSYRDARAVAAMEEAYRRTSESIYVLTEVRQLLPDAGS